MTPCHTQCVATLTESNRMCRESGTDVAACLARAQETSDTCLRACSIPPPPPPVSPAPPVPPATAPGPQPPSPPLSGITPCQNQCLLTYFESNRLCREQGTDVTACLARSQETVDTCIRTCPTPPPPP